MILRAVGIVLAALGAAGPLRAQCPDGTPPPCEAARRAAAARAGNAVAVLYLETRSRDSADVQLAAAVTEEIIEALGADPRLDVRSHFVSRALVRDDADPLAGARGQRIAWLVSGAFRASGDSIGLRIELTRTATSRVEWTRNLQQSRAEFAPLMSTVSRLIAGRVAGRMLPAQPARTLHQPDPSAYLLLLRARSRFREFSAPAALEAIALLERAVALDSLYADAWAALAASRLELWALTQQDAGARVRVEAGRALALDPDHPLALQALAFEHGVRNDFSVRTESLARRALALAPRSPESHITLAWVLMARGRPDEGVAVARAGVTLDSLSPLMWRTLGFRLADARRFDEAIAVRERMVRMEPAIHAWPERRADIAGYRLLQGRCAESEAEARVMADTVLLVRSLACLGRRDDARALFAARVARGLAATDMMTWALLGESDSLFAAAGRLDAAQPGAPVFPLVTNPAYDRYRSDPRFQAVLRRSGLEP